MQSVIFTTEEATFQFSQKSVIEHLKDKRSLYSVQELDILLHVIKSQPGKAILSFEEHKYFGYIVIDLISTIEGSVVCKNCGKQYRFNQLEAFTVGPDQASFKAERGKIRRFKSLFRKKKKLPGMYGGKGFKCPESHTIIFMITWRT